MLNTCFNALCIVATRGWNVDVVIRLECALLWHGLSISAPVGQSWLVSLISPQPTLYPALVPSCTQLNPVLPFWTVPWVLIYLGAITTISPIFHWQCAPLLNHTHCASSYATNCFMKILSLQNAAIIRQRSIEATGLCWVTPISS